MRTLISSLLVIAMTTPLVNGEEPHTIPRTITVQGQGVGNAAPDMATVTTGVTAMAATAQAALAENTAAMRKLMEVLKKSNIADKDVQTSGFSVYPEYHHNPRQPEDPPTLRGYRVNNQVNVRVRNLARLGEILDALVQAGSNQLSGISFDIADKRPVLNAARTNAMDDARGRAELYAQATGATVGKVISISEQTIEPPRPMMASARMMMADSAAVPIATGEQEISTNVNVMYELIVR